MTTTNQKFKVVLAVGMVSLLLALVFQILAVYDLYEVAQLNIERVGTDGSMLGSIVIAMLFFCTVSIGCFIWGLKKAFPSSLRVNFGIGLLVLGGIILMIASLFGITALFNIYAVYSPAAFLKAVILSVSAFVVSALLIISGYYSVKSGKKYSALQ